MAALGRVEIRLLGGFGVSVGSADVPPDTWRLRKAKTLVKLLALAPDHRVHHEQLGEALWPGRDAAAIRNNLHQALHAARSAFTAAGLDGRRVLRLNEGLVSFAEDVQVTVDVEEFTSAAQRARRTRDRAAYMAAVGHYGGELLPEDRYEDWATQPRESLTEQHSALLLELAQLHHDAGDSAAAIDVVRGLLVEHELHEPGRRELMRLLADSGRRQEALAEYETLRDALRRSLEADPDPETRQLYRRLLAGSIEEPEPVEPEEQQIHGSDNLPLAVSTFVGRDRDVVEVERLLAATRLMTLTGVGGAGKSRLAVEVARGQRSRFEHGVWLVELAPASDPDQVPAAVAQSLDLELPERGSPIPALVEQLAGRHLLLLLDNCEHLITACAELATAILRRCPGVVVLATSREALRVEGEIAWRVPSLALPDLSRLPDLPIVARQAAVRLFCERAAATEPDFELTSRNVRTVAELCVRLDGLPLALELAAARVRMLSPAQILERLGGALDVLGGGTRAGLNRQRTLAATLDWSHDLLDEAEAMVFRRLAVFAGSFALEAAEHVCGVDPLTHDDVLTLLGRLVDQSLVVKHSHGIVARYRLLETVRQYAGDRLAASGESAAIERRHRAWYRDWAKANDPEMAAGADEDALHHCDIEHDNLRAALRSALRDEPETALRLATSLWRFWLTRGHFAEGRRWLEAALAANPQPSTLRARGLIAIAVLNMRYASGQARLGPLADEVVAIHSDLADGVGLAQARHLAAVILFPTSATSDTAQHLDQACALAGDLGGDHVLAAATHTRGVIELSMGRPAEAQACFDTCESLLADLHYRGGGFFPAISSGFPVEWDSGGRPRAVFGETLVMGHRLSAEPAAAFLQLSRAWAARAAGDLDAAIRYGEQSAAAFHAHGWDYGVALAQNLLGNLHRLASRPEVARHYLERSLQIRARLGDRRATGVTLGGLGLLAASEGDHETGQRYLRRALALSERIEDGFGEAGMLLNLGVVSLRAGDLESARRLFEQVLQFHDAPGMGRTSGWVEVMLAEIAAEQGDAATAAGHLGAARTVFVEYGEDIGLAHCQRLQSAPASATSGPA